MANGTPVSINDPATDTPWSPSQNGMVEALQKNSDLTGTRISFNSTAAQDIVPAVAAQTVRIHRLRLIIAANAAVTALTVTGGTVKGVLGGLSVNGYARYVYSQTADYWFRTG